MGFPLDVEEFISGGSSVGLCVWCVGRGPQHTPRTLSFLSFSEKNLTPCRPAKPPPADQRSTTGFDRWRVVQRTRDGSKQMLRGITKPIPYLDYWCVLRCARVRYDAFSSNRRPVGAGFRGDVKSKNRISEILDL